MNANVKCDALVFGTLVSDTKEIDNSLTVALCYLHVGHPCLRGALSSRYQGLHWISSEFCRVPLRY